MERGANASIEGRVKGGLNLKKMRYTRNSSFFNAAETALERSSGMPDKDNDRRQIMYSKGQTFSFHESEGTTPLSTIKLFKGTRHMGNNIFAARTCLNASISQNSSATIPTFVFLTSNIHVP
jgi:hypothetical protein